jgi:phospholipase/lecithinase/hemolysin
MSVVARVAAFVKPWLFSAVLAIGLLAPQQAPADGIQRPFNRIVVFGDSLSDPGNAFALNGGQTVGPEDYGMTGVDELGIPEVFALIPEAPYATRHFSNGVTWIELLAGTIGLASSTKPAFTGSDARASNYAVGGATAFGPRSVDLTGQVDFFLRDVRGRASAHALYVIEIGGNDIRVALQAALTAPDPMAAAMTVIGAALASVRHNIDRLHAAGAREFLVWNAPDLGRTPALQRLNTLALPGIAGLATTLSGAYSQNLAGVLQGLGGLHGIAIVQFNAFAMLGNIQGDPGRFGLLDATTACIQPNVPLFGFPSSSPFRCAEPDRHLFWDGIHPTRAGHSIIALLVAKTLVAEILQDN